MFFYRTNKDINNAKIVDKIACVNFCKIYNFVGKFNFFVIAFVCIKVDMPPKLIINVEVTIERKSGKATEISMQPFVISIKPPKMIEIKFGKIENIGFKEEIITKNTAMIVPTDITLKEVSNIIE